jgi:hypothetical protein
MCEPDDSGENDILKMSAESAQAELSMQTTMNLQHTHSPLILRLP